MAWFRALAFSKPPTDFSVLGVVWPKPPIGKTGPATFPVATFIVRFVQARAEARLAWHMPCAAKSADLKGLKVKPFSLFCFDIQRKANGGLKG